MSLSTHLTGCHSSSEWLLYIPRQSRHLLTPGQLESMRSTNKYLDCSVTTAVPATGPPVLQHSNMCWQRLSVRVDCFGAICGQGLSKFGMPLSLHDFISTITRRTMITITGLPHVFDDQESRFRTPHWQAAMTATQNCKSENSHLQYDDSRLLGFSSSSGSNTLAIFWRWAY